MQLILFFFLFACPVLKASHHHCLLCQFTTFTKPERSDAEFSAVALYDDRQISHYSNEENKWKTDDRYSEIWIPGVSKQRFLREVKALANCANSRCDGVHTLQRRIGCEVDAEKNVKMFDEFRYDGEDFIALDLSKTQWVEKNPKAEEASERWNKNQYHRESVKNDLEICRSLISTFKSLGTPPKVHMFASEAPHDRMKLNLMCLATGFYPKHIEMKITLNDEELSFNSTGVRPNEDQTFQMEISVEIDRDQRNGFQCHVTHGNQSCTRSWDGKCFRCSGNPILAAIVPCSVAVTAVVLSVILILRRKHIVI